MFLRSHPRLTRLVAVGSALVGVPFLMAVAVLLGQAQEGLFGIPHLLMAAALVLGAGRLHLFELRADLPRVLLDDEGIALRDFGSRQLTEYSWDDIEYSFLGRDEKGPILTLVFRPGRGPAVARGHRLLDGNLRPAVDYRLVCMEEGYEHTLRLLGAWLNGPRRDSLAVAAPRLALADGKAKPGLLGDSASREDRAGCGEADLPGSA